MTKLDQLRVSHLLRSLFWAHLVFLLDFHLFPACNQQQTRNPYMNSTGNNRTRITIDSDLSFLPGYSASQQHCSHVSKRQLHAGTMTSFWLALPNANSFTAKTQKQRITLHDEDQAMNWIQMCSQLGWQFHSTVCFFHGFACQVNWKLFSKYQTRLQYIAVNYAQSSEAWQWCRSTRLHWPQQDSLHSCWCTNDVDLMTIYWCQYRSMVELHMTDMTLPVGFQLALVYVGDLTVYFCKNWCHTNQSGRPLNWLSPSLGEPHKNPAL